MKIRDGNGQAAGILVLRQTATSLRVAIRGTDDLLELRKAAGTWVTDDGDVFIDNPRRASHSVTEEDCICPAGLAALLVDLLYTDSSDDMDELPAALARPA